MDAGPSAPTRTSARVRNKSSRALESESTERLLSAARTAQKEKQTPAPDGSEAPPKEEDKPAGKRKTRTSKYCVCHEDKKGPMIECGECLNWFHFGCVDMTEEEAERIHKYVCAECAGTSGEKTTYIFDVKSFPSPDPPSDVEVKEDDKSKPGTTKGKARKPPKRKQKAKSEAKEKENDEDSAHSESAGSASEDSGSEAAPTDDESDSGSDAEARPQRKRARTSPAKEETKPTKSPAKRPSLDKRASGSGHQGSSGPETLPPARQYVLDKMAATIRNIFGEDAMDEAKAEKFGREIESTLFNNLKEVVKGKEAAGGRYKAQFTLLHGSLSKELRPDLKTSIVDGTLTPAEIALLTSENLATAEQLADIQAARAENLRQHVKIKAKEKLVRFGRDGFEEVEDEDDKREREQRHEEAQARRESGVVDEPVPEPAASGASSPQSETGTAEPMSPGRRRSSASISGSPTVHRPSVSLSSAWGSKVTAAQNDEGVDIGQDQDTIDLSDIVTGDVDYGDGLDEVNEQVEQDVWKEFLTKPVGWSGGIINPAEESPHTPPVQLRQISGRTPQPTSYWSHLLPRPDIAITGRVPTATSLQYLSDRRFDRTKELVAVSFTLSPDATEDQRKTWTQIIEFHISRGRHAIFHPYDNRPPPTAARELYLIPLRPEDPTPELLDLVNNYSLPKESRSEPVFVGVFVANREATHSHSPAEPTKQAQSSRPRPTPPVPSFTPVPPPAPAPVPPPNLQLQALMASLDANAIAGALGGPGPSVPAAPARPPGAAPYPMPPFPPNMAHPPPGIGRPYPDYRPYPPPPPGGGYSPHDAGGYSPHNAGGYSPHDARPGLPPRNPGGYPDNGRWGAPRGGGRWG